MKSRAIQIIIATLILVFVIAGFYLFKAKQRSEQSPFANYTNKIQSELYARAEAVWDGQMITKPFRPQNINETPIHSSRGIHVEWTAPTQTYNHFLITVTQPETGWMRKESREHDGFGVDLTDLMPDTKYVFNVQACLNPACETWLIAEQEASARTDRMRLMILENAVDISLPFFNEEEPIADMYTRAVMDIQHEDGTAFVEDEKNPLTFGAVFIDRKTDKIYIQSQQGRKTVYVQWLNP